MGRYIVKRILILIPLLLAISLFTFFLVHLAPGVYVVHLAQGGRAVTTRVSVVR